MDVADLKILAAVARHGSMNKAAAELNTVQSNVTARIKALEDDIGVPLFHRHSRGVTPSAACERLLPYASRIAHLLKEAGEAARDDGIPSGLLRIGTLETTAALRLPGFLADYARAFPRVALTVIAGTTAALIDDVLEFRLDGAFVAGPVRHADLTEKTIFREEMVLLTPPTVVGWDDLGSLRNLRTIVFRRGCSYRQHLETLLMERGLPTAEPLEFGSIDAIIGCVGAGVGITLLPRGVAAEAIRQGRVAAHPLPEEYAVVDTVFIRRRDCHVSSAMEAFLRIVYPAPERMAAE